MFRDLPQYPEYALNSSPWLGQLPAHWKTQRTKSLLVERVQKGYPDEPLLAATQSRGVIRKSEYGTRTVTATKDLHLLKLVEVGDFVISLRSFQGGIERCFHRGIISPAYTVLTAKSDGYRDYLTHLFKSTPFVSSLTLAVTGIREGQNIDYSTLAVDLLPVPPPEEQAAIVKYLAHANARIDKAIAAKRRLITLLEEEKRAVADLILGQLNEGVREVRHVLSQLVDCEHKTAPFVAGEPYWVLRTSSVKSGEIVWSGAYTTDAASYEVWTSRAVPKPGDVIFTREAPAGEAAVIPDGRRVALGQRTVLMKVRNEIMDPQFLVHQIYAGLPRQRIALATQGSTVGHFNMDDIGWMRVAVPDIEVQRKLVREIDDAKRAANDAIVKTRSEITLLQEFRTRLVADVVTGQVDVRAISAMLSEVPEYESSHLDDPIRTQESDFREEELADG